MNKSKRLMRSPAGIAAIIIVMISMILGVVVFSTKKEAQLKEELKPTADPSARPGDSQAEIVISPPSEEKVIISENGNDATQIKSEGSYLNTKVLSVSTGYGMTFSIGLDNSSITDALYLNPHFEYIFAGNPEEAYGYLVRSERIPLEYAESSPSPAWSTKYVGLTDFAILGRTYDKVVSASALDSDNFGVRWIDSPGFGGRENSGDKLRILIVRISDGTLMGAVKVDIAYNAATRTYSFENLMNNDVSCSNELTSIQREQLIASTIQFLAHGNDQMTLSVTKEELESQSASIIVENTPAVYYNKLFDTEGNVVAAGRFSNCDIYAVNINCDGYGFFTVYFAPEPQANGLAASTLNEGDELKLVMIGYDAFAPFTVDNFNSFLLPEDIEKFAAANY